MNNKIEDNLKRVLLSNGETLAYREGGDTTKTPFLFVHGSFISSVAYTPYLPYFSESYHVIAPDLRGHGESSYNNPINSLDDFVDDLKQFVDAIGVKEFMLFGWSMGGPICLKFAAKYPGQVLRLILHCSVSVKGFPAYKVNEEGVLTQERAKTKEEVNNQPFLKAMLDAFSQRDKEKIRAMFVNDNFKNGLSPDIVVNDALKCRCFDCLFPIVNMYNLTQENNGFIDGTNEISKIKCKVLIIHGGKDFPHPTEHAVYLKEALGDLGQIKIYEEGGHNVIGEYTEEVVSLIHKFCTV